MKVKTALILILVEYLVYIVTTFPKLIENSPVGLGKQIVALFLFMGLVIFIRESFILLIYCILSLFYLNSKNTLNTEFSVGVFLFIAFIVLGGGMNKYGFLIELVTVSTVLIIVNYSDIKIGKFDS